MDDLFRPLSFYPREGSPKYPAIKMRRGDAFDLWDPSGHSPYGGDKINLSVRDENGNTVAAPYSDTHHLGKTTQGCLLAGKFVNVTKNQD